MSINIQAAIDIVTNGLVNRGIDPIKIDSQLFNAVVGIVDGVLEGERIDLRWAIENNRELVTQYIDKIGAGNVTCKCDGGWIRHQHPMKPIGVIMNSTPCLICNYNGLKPDPLTEAKYTITHTIPEDK